jgi:hypothetical protein
VAGEKNNDVVVAVADAEEGAGTSPDAVVVVEQISNFAVMAVEEGVGTSKFVLDQEGAAEVGTIKRMWTVDVSVVGEAEAGRRFVSAAVVIVAMKGGYSRGMKKSQRQRTQGLRRDRVQVQMGQVNWSYTATVTAVEAYTILLTVEEEAADSCSAPAVEPTELRATIAEKGVRARVTIPDSTTAASTRLAEEAVGT